MNAKKLATGILVLFVVVSAGYLIYQEGNRKEISEKPSVAVENVEPGGAVEKPEPPEIEKPDGGADAAAGEAVPGARGNEKVEEAKDEGAGGEKARKQELEQAGDQSPMDNETGSAAGEEQSRKTIAYYFYSQPRCASCKKIEAFTEEAIRTGFEKELKSGELEWRLVDVKEKGNEHFIQDYQLYSKSVVLVNMKNGEQSDWKNLQEVWNLLNDKQKFIDYIRGETRAFLEGNG